LAPCLPHGLGVPFKSSLGVPNGLARLLLWSRRHGRSLFAAAAHPAAQK